MRPLVAVVVAPTGQGIQRPIVIAQCPFGKPFLPSERALSLLSRLKMNAKAVYREVQRRKSRTGAGTPLHIAHMLRPLFRTASACGCDITGHGYTHAARQHPQDAALRSGKMTTTAAPAPREAGLWAEEVATDDRERPWNLGIPHSQGYCRQYTPRISSSPMP